MDVTFVVRGKLGQIPAGTWANGSTRREYLDIGDQRYDYCWVPDYLESSLNDCMSEEVELSFCRLDKKGGFHLCAIRRENGKVLRLPEPGGLLGQMAATGFVWGIVTFLTTWLVMPVFVIPIWVLSKIGVTSESIFGSVTFGGLLLVWLGQLSWVLFYSQKLSPKVRLSLINKARNAL